MLPDLSTMDATLYNNLMFLKTFEGDAQDLFLNKVTSHGMPSLAKLYLYFLQII